jgi:hypothetical protein
LRFGISVPLGRVVAEQGGPVVVGPGVCVVGSLERRRPGPREVGSSRWLLVVVARDLGGRVQDDRAPDVAAGVVVADLAAWCRVRVRVGPEDVDGCALKCTSVLSFM